MITNIKYINVFLAVCLISLPLIGISKSPDSTRVSSNKNESKWIQKAKSLFWLEINSKYSNQEILSNYTGINIKGLSVSEILNIEKKMENNLIVAGSTNSVKESNPFPPFSTIQLIEDSVLTGKYIRAVQARMSLLHFDLDPEAGISKGFLFEHLYQSDSQIELKTKIDRGNSFIIKGDLNFWINRLHELVKDHLVTKRSIISKIKDVAMLTDSISSHKSEFIPFSDSKIENPVYAKYHLSNNLQKNIIREIYEKSFRIQTNNEIPIITLAYKHHAVLTNPNDTAFIQGVANYGQTTFFDIAHFYENIDNIKLFDRLFIHFEQDINSADLQRLQSISSDIDIFIFFHDAKKNLLNNFHNVLWHPENNLYTTQIAPQIFFGGIQSSALPIRLSFGNPAEAGLNNNTLQNIDDLVHQAIQDSVFPGAQVLVARKGKVVFNKQFGHLTYEKHTRVKYNTIYDLASVTKVLSTVPALMVIDSMSRIDLDAKISTYLPETLGTNKENMTIRDILTHQAGIYPYWPFWKNTISKSGTDYYYQNSSSDQYNHPVIPGLYSNNVLKDSIWQWTMDLKLNSKFDSFSSFKYVYSDLGFLLLKRLSEKFLLQPLDSFALENFYEPLGMNFTSFLPACRFPLENIAPTESDLIFRKSLVHGNVHDQNAAMLGGIAGHSGLFGNALDMAKFMQMYFQGIYGGQKYFSKELIESYTSQQYKNNRRGLGWDKKDMEGGGNTSYFASTKAFGHTGFSGTSVWVDPEFDLILVFLSNRIHPNAENFKIVESSIRTRIQDIVYEAMWDYHQYGDN